MSIETVKELKQFLETIPDDMTIAVKGDDNIIWKGLAAKIETTDLKYLNETEDEILEESSEALIFF
jgi:hypothetical protein